MQELSHCMRFCGHIGFELVGVGTKRVALVSNNRFLDPGVGRWSWKVGPSKLDGGGCALQGALGRHVRLGLGGARVSKSKIRCIQRVFRLLEFHTRVCSSEGSFTSLMIMVSLSIH